MLNIYFLLLASLLCSVQCLPLETQSKTASGEALHLYVNNSTQAENYHLTSVMTELEDIDDEIAKELDTILPYINFLFDALLGRTDDKEDDDDGCVNDMIIQLVPDETTEDQDTPTEPPVAA